MERAEILIDTEYISMDKLLKFAGIADTGGQAFMMVEDGIITLNGVPVTEKRKKVRPGDIVNIDNQIELTVVQE
ncbi:MAG: RNA-binding S4 domain-containing protein [Phascolarctobacterium sp.]|nr:RNA-binding S4 domain-containing protein [Phascolarctobacterium sp.]